MMAFIDMDFVQFYQPPAKPNLSGRGEPQAVKSGVPVPRIGVDTPTALEPSLEAYKPLQDNSMAEFTDTAALSLKDCPTPSHALIIDFENTKALSGGIVRLRC